MIGASILEMYLLIFVNVSYVIKNMLHQLDTTAKKQQHESIIEGIEILFPLFQEAGQPFFPVE